MEQIAWVFDLNGTISDTQQREWLNPRTNPSASWDAYFLASQDDMPKQPVIDMMRANAHFHIVVLTGRGVIARGVTENWLADHNVYHNQLIMREGGDHRSSVDFKLAAVKVIQTTHEIGLWIDNDRRVTSAIRWLGIPTRLVSSHAYTASQQREES